MSPETNSEKFHTIKRVLIVDDDHDTLEATRFLIELYSKETICDIAADPYEAMLALSDQNYDFVLVDFKLPSLNGEKLLKKMDEQIEQDPLIHESGRFSTRVPVVIMSGHPVDLPSGFSLKHFELMDVIRKRDLPGFLRKMKPKDNVAGLPIESIWVHSFKNSKRVTA